MAAPTKLELAQIAYAEVLDATKHQDAKIGRVLGAVAFFAGGVLAFADREVLLVRYRLGSQEVPLVSLCMGLFLMLAAISAMLFVLSMMTPLTLPGRKRVDDPRQVKSYLFFQLIAKTDEDIWTKKWQDSADGSEAVLASDFESNFVAETHNIAKRASRKHQRAQEAAALLVMAIPFFCLTVLLSMDVIIADLAKGETLGWTVGRRVLVGAVLFVVAASLVFVQSDKSRHGQLALFLAFPLFVALLTAGSGFGPSVAVAFVGLVATWAFVTSVQPDTKNRKSKQHEAQLNKDADTSDKQRDKSSTTRTTTSTTIGRESIIGLLGVCILAGGTVVTALDIPIAQLGLAIFTLSLPTTPNFGPNLRALRQSDKREDANPIDTPN